MSEVVQFRRRARVTRLQAIQWFSQHVDVFPSLGEPFVGPEMFHGWRFVTGTDGVVYFANCIDPGIDERELLDFKSKAA